MPALASTTACQPHCLPAHMHTKQARLCQRTCAPTKPGSARCRKECPWIPWVQVPRWCTNVSHRPAFAPTQTDTQNGTNSHKLYAQSKYLSAARLKLCIHMHPHKQAHAGARTCMPTCAHTYTSTRAHVHERAFARTNMRTLPAPHPQALRSAQVGRHPWQLLGAGYVHMAAPCSHQKQHARACCAYTGSIWAQGCQQTKTKTKQLHGASDKCMLRSRMARLSSAYRAVKWCAWQVHTAQKRVRRVHAAQSRGPFNKCMLRCCMARGQQVQAAP